MKVSDGKECRIRVVLTSGLHLDRRRRKRVSRFGCVYAVRSCSLDFCEYIVKERI